ncbi:MAG TPA: UDP-glucose 4-epimerase GalE [Bacteroidia bacterium]|nr:UDP-glucose 4-epimerase GalE [Bacteroidia bacterium]HNP99051.1 UDP-glucose 4-epimerase GalE [Bacteroidia bacterium]
MNVLVTGGTGYIGSHTVIELLNKGYNPILIDNLSNSREEVVQSIEDITGKRVDFFNIDLCRKKTLEKFFSVYKIDAIIHFAAFKAVGESVQDPLKYYRNNLLSLVNLLEIVQEKQLDNFVFSSSCSVYGQATHQPVTEKTPLQKAESPYGNSKKISEEILADVLRNGNFKAMSLRYFNPGGAHSSALLGEYPLQAPNNLVPVITQTAIGKRESMTVFGDNYSTPDGTCIRDYIHVVDIAKAHVAAIDYLIQNKNKQALTILNLGSGTGHSVLDAIHAFEKVTGRKVNYSIGPRREGDIEKVWADITLASKELGWKPENSLDDIMRSAWAWEQQLASKMYVQ